MPSNSPMSPDRQKSFNNQTPKMVRRSSFEVHASSDRLVAMRALENRVLQREKRRTKEAEEQGIILDEEARGDTLDPAIRELLNNPPEERETDHVDVLVEHLGKTASHFFSQINDDQQTDVARCALYHFFDPGEVVCDEDDETAYYFVVLSGSVEVDEARVSHTESAKNRGGAQAQMRKHIMRTGRGFHHFPLVMQSRFYGYNARASSNYGAALLMISKADYISSLRRSVDREMTETVRRVLQVAHGMPRSRLALRISSLYISCVQRNSPLSWSHCPHCAFLPPGKHAEVNPFLFVVVGHLHFALVLLV
jgi:hypothetical protein